MSIDKETIQNFEKKFLGWKDEIRFDIKPNYIENIYEIRSGMPKREKIEQLNMNEYKRLIIKELEAEYDEVKNANLNITDDELETNRFETGPYAGRKITKVLTELTTHPVMKYRNEQRIDYFNKLRQSDASYFTDSDPMVLLDYYSSIQTCLSPGGENQSNLIKFLFSPYVFIAGDEKKTVRMVIYADYEKKYVFLNPIYGSFDSMFAMSVVNHFIKKGFTFSESVHTLFNTQFLSYTDRFHCAYLHYVYPMNGTVATKETLDYCDLFKKPDYVSYEGDGIYESFRYTSNPKYTISINFHDSYGVRDSNDYFCSTCGEVVAGVDYDYDYEQCYDCAHHGHYCGECEEDHIDDYNWDYDRDMCVWCAEREEQLENNICMECGEGFYNQDFDQERSLCLDCLTDLKEEEYEEEDGVSTASATDSNEYTTSTNT